MAFPRGDADLMVWLNNFADKINKYTATLGLTPADVTAVQDDAAMLDYLVGNFLPAYKSGMLSCTAYKNLILDGPLGTPGGDLPTPPDAGTPPKMIQPGVIPRLRKLLQRIQGSTGYTEAIGEDLGITGTTDGAAALDPATAKPTARAVALPKSEVRIEFDKRRFDGVVIEARHPGEKDWSRLGTDNYSPYLDTRTPTTPGQPEIREYRLRYILRDEEVGEWSDIISATTTP